MWSSTRGISHCSYASCIIYYWHTSITNRCEPVHWVLRLKLEPLERAWCWRGGPSTCGKYIVRTNYHTLNPRCNSDVTSPEIPHKITYISYTTKKTRQKKCNNVEMSIVFLILNKWSPGPAYREHQVNVLNAFVPFAVKFNNLVSWYHHPTT